MKKFLMALALVMLPGFAMAEMSVQPLTVQAMDRDQFLNYNFGTSFVYSGRFQDFVLTANGPDSTFIRGMRLSGSMDYRADTNCPQILMPGQRCIIRVFFQPMVPGSHWGDLTVYLRDSNIYIRLYGHAIR